MYNELDGVLSKVFDFVQSHIKEIEPNKLHMLEHILQELNSVIYDYNDNKWIGNDTIISRIFSAEREVRGEFDYSSVQLSENSLGIYVLKRDISFLRKTGLTGASKGCIVEIIKKGEKYGVKLVNHPYAKIPTVLPPVQRYITEKQLKYYLGEKLR